MPDPVNSGFWVKGQKDVTYRNLNINGGVFGLRYCENILIENGQVYGNKTGDVCVVGSYQGYGPSKNITIRNIYFHDMTINDPSQHHEALYVSCVDGILIENCKFERLWGNTADLFFTGWEIPGNAKNVTVRGCHFLPPTNPTRDDAIQWNDVNGGFVNHLYENNLFDGAQPYLGTLNKPVTNFVVGINYGTTPSQGVIDAAKKLGVKFTELPFRPKEKWPGAVTTPTPPEPTPTPPPGTDPCADVKAQLANMTAQRDAALSQSQALQQKIDAAKVALG